MSVLGRFLVTKKDSDIASFKTPSLRNVLITAAYFHDGSQATLWDVMDHYNKGDGIKDPWLDEDMQPLALSESEIDDVVAFMASLTSAQYKGERFANHRLVTGGRTAEGLRFGPGDGSSIGRAANRITRSFSSGADSSTAA
jgi:cytochrome c peroxidase